MTRFAMPLWILTTLLSHWRRHRMQLATLLIGLIAATALWSGVQAINQQARESYARAAAMFDGGNTAMLISRDGPTMPQQVFVALRRAGWPVSPVLEGRVLLHGRSFRLLGIEPVSLPDHAGPAGMSVGLTSKQESEQKSGPDLQAFLSPPGQTLLAPDTLRDLGAVAGSTPDLGGTLALPPLTVQPQLMPGVLVVDIGVAQRLLKRPGQISRLLLDSTTPAPGALPDSIAGTPLQRIEAGAPSDLQRLTDSFHLNLTAFGLLSFVVGLFIVNSAIGLAVEQRLPMLRTMRACGVSARMLVAVLLGELLGLAFCAGLIGLICGYGIAALLLPDVAASLRGLYGAQIPGQLTLAPQWWAAGLGMSLLGALAAAAGSLLKVYRLPVLAAAQPYAWQQAQQRWLAGQGALALVVALIAAGAAVFGDSLAAGFVVLAAMLLAAALALPVLLSLLLWLGERLSRGALAQWLWADSRQQLSGLSLALMALLLALAVNVGVGTMVGSFSRTFTAWLDQRLAAEIYLNASSDTQATEIVTWLRQRPDIRAILPNWRAETTLQGWPTEVLGFADDATYRQHWPLLADRADTWQRVADGSGALLSEQLARRLKLTLGDRVQVPTSSGPWEIEVVGIYPDYGNARGQLGVANDALAAHWPEVARTRYGLRVAPDAIADVMTGLQQRFQLDSAHLIDQATLKSESLRIFSATFAVTSALNALTLGVAGIALLTSLLTLGHHRQPQLAPLWALGLTRRRLALLDLLKTMGVALLTALLALPVGLAVAWCLLTVVNVQAFGWRLPMQIFPAQLFELLGVAMLAALLATGIPLLRLLRMQPADLLRVFANAR